MGWVLVELLFSFASALMLSSNLLTSESYFAVLFCFSSFYCFSMFMSSLAIPLINFDKTFKDAWSACPFYPMNSNAFFTVSFAY